MSEAALVSIHDVTCPDCGPHRQSPANRVRKVRREWRHSDGFQTWHCARCGSKGSVSNATPEPAKGRISNRTLSHSTKTDGGDTSTSATEKQGDHLFASDPQPEEKRRELARQLWASSISAAGTPVEAYLNYRGIHCDIPGTVRYLPPRGHHPHAMIVPFGVATESTCGRYAITPDQVMGVHLTRLSRYGGRKFEGERAKIMLGPSKGFPLMLFPPNDGLGMVIAEGIENALSVHASTGLGAWAAGSAGRLPDMAAHVQPFIESVLIFADDDPAGMTGAEALRESLCERGHEVRLKALPAMGAAHGI